MPPPRTTDWLRYEKLVLEQLERHENALTRANDVISTHSSEIAVLKWKQYIIGAIFGVIGSALFSYILSLIPK